MFKLNRSSKNIPSVRVSLQFMRGVVNISFVTALIWRITQNTGHFVVYGHSGNIKRIILFGLLLSGSQRQYESGGSWHRSKDQKLFHPMRRKAIYRYRGHLRRTDAVYKSKDSNLSGIKLYIKHWTRKGFLTFPYFFNNCIKLGKFSMNCSCQRRAQLSF